MERIHWYSLFMLITFFISSIAKASIVIPMYSVDGNQIGTVKVDNTIFGLILTPNLKKLPPGVHGFHIHEYSNCGDHGMAAGGHFDPQKTNKHRGPYDDKGHLGDLPVLIVDSNGNATLPVLAPRLKLTQLEGHSLMIHAGSDNYSDNPEKLGGGGARIACGAIEHLEPVSGS